MFWKEKIKNTSLLVEQMTNPPVNITILLINSVLIKFKPDYMFIWVKVNRNESNC